METSQQRTAQAYTAWRDLKASRVRQKLLSQYHLPGYEMIVAVRRRRASVSGVWLVGGGD
jgi:hypothetical protein